MGNSNNGYNPFASLGKPGIKSTLIEIERENKGFNVFDSITKPSPALSYGKQQNWKSSITVFSEGYTSDDLISIMPEPFRSNLEGLKRRACNRGSRVL